MRGLKRGRDEEPYPPPAYKLARREYSADVSSASGMQHILSPGTILPLWGFGDADGVLGYIEVNNNKIDIGGSAFIVGGQMTDGSYQVALKVFTMPMHDYQVTLIRRELDTVRKLAPHPNILPFLGTFPHHNVVLVSPYMREGNMLQYLKQNPAVNRHKLIVQVAEALSHVHEVHKLVHGDLKCENVLISDHGDALLADFGLSTAIEKAASDVTTVSDIRQKSTFRFNAPELMLGSVTERYGNGLLRARSKTTATDVYAFGMLVLQAYTEQRPWAEYRDDIQIITAVCITKRMHMRPDSKSHAVAVGFTDQHWNLCSSCWNYEPHNRPTIRHVLSALVQSLTRENPQQPAEQSVVHEYFKQLAAVRAVTMPVAEVETAMRSEEDALRFRLDSANDFQSVAMGGPPDPASSIDPNFDLASTSALYALIKNITNADSTSFPNTFDSFDLPPVAGPSSPKTSAANNGVWAFDFTRYDQDEAASKANTPDLVHPNHFDAGPETVYYTPAEFYEPLVNDAPGNGLGGNGPTPKGDPSGFDSYLSMEGLELVAGPDAAYYTPGLVDEPLVIDGSAWAITQV